MRIGEVAASVELKVRSCWNPFLTAVLAAIALAAALGSAAKVAANYATSRVEQSKRLAALGELSDLKVMLERYRTDNGYYPTTLQGLDAIMNDETDPGMIRPPMPPAHAPRDPWGHRFKYESDGHSYYLGSLGPSGAGNDPDLTITIQR